MLISRIGIGMLLLGLAFLFKYSIDRAWITEEVRVAFGVVLGIFLLMAGLKTAPRRLSSILSGGGFAVLYVTLFAASPLYQLIDAVGAFRCALLITTLAFASSLYSNDVWMSVVAIVGGLTAPLVLVTQEPNVPGLGIYVSLIMAASAGIYLYRGWRLPLLAGAATSWLVLALGTRAITTPNDFDALSLQASILVYWAAFGVCPVVREWLRHRDPERWSPVDTGNHFRSEALRHPVLMLIVATPLIAVSLVPVIWDVRTEVWGWIASAVSLVYVWAAYLQWPQAAGLADVSPADRILYRLGQAHRLAAVILLSLGLLLTYDGPLVTLLFAAEAALVLLVSRRYQDVVLRGTAIVIFGGIALVIASIALFESPSLPILEIDAASDLAAIIILAFCALRLETGLWRRIGALTAHVLFLVWLSGELNGLPPGAAYVTVAWVVYAIVLFIIGLRSDLDVVRVTGLATLLLALTKLLVFDLASLSMVWRILLFLGLGAVLLLLSYFMPGLWRTSSSGTGTGPAAQTAG